MLTRIIVSGEGRTDIGGSRSGQAFASEDDFEKGPMYVLTERMFNRFLPDWNSDYYEQVPLEPIYVAHGLLKRIAKERAKGAGKFILASKKRHKEQNGKYKQARELAKLAVERECQMAVYFVDCDGKNADKSTSSTLQSEIVKSLNEGFKDGGLEAGVAMVPKPTSESWLICHCQGSSYRRCDLLETSLSGNDNCPDEQSPKKVLASYIGAEYDDAEVFVKVDELDLDRLDMPSFNQYKTDLINSIRHICGDVTE